MSFFGIFGGGKDDKNCGCNSNLKDHLKKCAGYGERPAAVDGCSSAKTDGCDDLSGPPTCKGKTEAPKCCPVNKYNKPKLFVPKCNVPPTATFKCPASTCDAVCDDTSGKSANAAPKKPDCTPKGGQSKGADDSKSKSSGGGSCGGSGSSNGNGGKGSGKGGSGSGSGSGSENDCEPRPLQM